ncbi:MAG: hypothetical protein HZA32_19330 [Opitutae bacterium]|nr:hypothetical protein [Opitutae bacterium]
MSGEGTVFSRDVLLAVGFTLLIAGVFLRGFARSTRRSLALRRQHELHVHGVDRGAAAEEPVKTTHFERNVGRYAAAGVALGLAVIVVAFFRS